MARGLLPPARRTREDDGEPNRSEAARPLCVPYDLDNWRKTALASRLPFGRKPARRRRAMRRARAAALAAHGRVRFPDSLELLLADAAALEALGFREQAAYRTSRPKRACSTSSPDTSPVWWRPRDAPRRGSVARCRCCRKLRRLDHHRRPASGSEISLYAYLILRVRDGASVSAPAQKRGARWLPLSRWQCTSRCRTRCGR